MITIVEEVKGGLDAELTNPPCPNCGTPGTYKGQTFDFVDGFFTIVDIYVCLKCNPLERKNDENSILTH